jgi:hypothetical protein
MTTHNNKFRNLMSCIFACISASAALAGPVPYFDSNRSDAGAGFQSAFATGEMSEELAKLIVSSVGIGGSAFGGAVAVSGNIAVVGANADTVNGLITGSAFVFDISDPSNPIEMSMLVASDAADDDVFGYSVAMSGNIAVIGALGDDDNGYGSGSAYVFDLSDPANPVEASKLLASDGAPSDRFGHSVAMSGSAVIVAATQDDDDWVDSGSVYVFDISDPTNPLEMSKLHGIDEPPFSEGFGWSIAMSGDSVAVGAYLSGIVLVYDISFLANPAPKSIHYPGAEPSDDWFGRSVAMSGSIVVVGAPKDTDNGPESGSSYVFDLLNPSNPIEMSKLLASDGAAYDNYGWSVGVSGNTAVVGAITANGNGNMPRQGATYMYDITNPANPTIMSKLVASDGFMMDGFGWSVALSGDIAVVGAGFSGAHAYVFDATNETLSCDGDANGDNTVDVNDITYVLFRLGVSPPDGDANGDGAIDVNDISYVLFRLGFACS